MRVSRDGRELFQRRMRQFLLISIPGKTLLLGNDDWQTFVGPSESAGLISSLVHVRPDQLRYYKECTTPCVSWTSYRVLLPDHDPRSYTGCAQLLEPRGLSIISDVDDTLKHSNVPNRRELFRNTFERTFCPIEGMPELYRECAQYGAAFHYVSASPWQLYDFLAEFWQENALPLGSFHLKRFRLRDTPSKLRRKTPQTGYKQSAIEPLFHDYPQRQFIMIGDGGEQDAEIYATFFRRYPDRILHIYIRILSDQPSELDRLHYQLRDVPASRYHLFKHPSEIRSSILGYLK